MTKDYIGTKRVTAAPRMRNVDEDGKPVLGVPLNEVGYAVVYSDGYQSWSPKEAFEAAYQPITAMGFEGALWALKRGHRVARAGWNGEGMRLEIVGAGGYELYDSDDKGRSLGMELLPWIGMLTAQGGFVPWLASQTDMLADDWHIVE